MTWSIQQVAKVSGVTARTLRYYGEIGILRPTRLGANGYRFYEREQLLRLPAYAGTGTGAVSDSSLGGRGGSGFRK
jgi:hypothetical protein